MRYRPIGSVGGEVGLPSDSDSETASRSATTRAPVDVTEALVTPRSTKKAKKDKKQNGQPAPEPAMSEATLPKSLQNAPVDVNGAVPTEDKVAKKMEKAAKKAKRKEEKYGKKVNETPRRRVEGLGSLAPPLDT